MDLRLGPCAPIFSNAKVTPFDRYPLNSYLVDDPEIDLDDWRLEVSGLVARPGEYGLDALRALPRVTQNTRHICIEGWDVIGSFGGTRLSELLARHPQSLLCDEMYGRPLTREHGAPLRLVLPTKLGYKHAIHRWSASERRVGAQARLLGRSGL